jgi:hypothetical protein
MTCNVDMQWAETEAWSPSPSAQDKPSRPSPTGQGRSSSGVLHLDPRGLARSGERVDGRRDDQKDRSAPCPLRASDQAAKAGEPRSLADRTLYPLTCAKAGHGSAADDLLGNRSSVGVDIHQPEPLNHHQCVIIHREIRVAHLRAYLGAVPELFMPGSPLPD